MPQRPEFSTDRSTPRSLWKIAAYTSGVVLACVILIYVFTHVFFDGFLKNRIVGSLEQAYPSYAVRIGSLRYHVLRNSIECDSIEVIKHDSSESCSIGRLFLSGINRRQFISGGGDVPQGLASSYADAHDIRLNFLKAQYELSCSRIQVSAPDSSLYLEGLTLHPWSDDEQFFAASKFRTTRFLLDVPICRVSGLGCVGLLLGKDYRARDIQLDSASLELLVNKDKPGDPHASTPGMPNEVLAEIKEPVFIDNFGIRNGRFVYQERFTPYAKPAAIWCDSINVNAQRIGNLAGGGDTATIRAYGTFLNAAVMELRMTLPLAAGEFSARYSGSLTEMALPKFNSYIEIAEHKRLKTGIVYEASFAVDVNAGRATGTVHSAYKDLKIVAIDGRTGSESGIGNRFLSFLANNIKLRTSNVPDKSGVAAIGKVKYSRKRSDTFIYFSWIALRSGIQDLVGF